MPTTDKPILTTDPPVMAAGDTVDLSSGWDVFWGAVSSDIGGLITLMTVIGGLMVAGAILGFIYQKRKAQGGYMQGSGVIWITLIIGAALAAPNALIPMILNIADFAANGFIALLERVSS